MTRLSTILMTRLSTIVMTRLSTIVMMRSSTTLMVLGWSCLVLDGPDQSRTSLQEDWSRLVLGLVRTNQDQS